MIKREGVRRNGIQIRISDGRKGRPEDGDEAVERPAASDQGGLGGWFQAAGPSGDVIGATKNRPDGSGPSRPQEKFGDRRISRKWG